MEERGDRREGLGTRDQGGRRREREKEGQRREEGVNEGGRDRRCGNMCKCQQYCM